MVILLSNRAADNIADAPSAVQKAFYKQLRFLASNLGHPSLHAKKYDESNDIWHGRVNKDWRFYFKIEDDSCLITDVTQHPK
jgi:plasmid maintenance system killer protein